MKTTKLEMARFVVQVMYNMEDLPTKNFGPVFTEMKLKKEALTERFILAGKSAAKMMPGFHKPVESQSKTKLPKYIKPNWIEGEDEDGDEEYIIELGPIEVLCNSYKEATELIGLLREQRAIALYTTKL